MDIPSFDVGDLRIAVIAEQELAPGTGAWLMPGLTPADLERAPELVPEYVARDGALRLDSHSYVLTVDGRRIVVDTGIGNGKSRANPAWNDLDTAYLDRLSAAGFAPEDVDLVMLTHLHTDHVGWNTRRVGGDWVPTFPRARYVVSRAERDYWAGIELGPERAAMFADSIHPIRDAGLLDALDIAQDGLEIAPGVRLTPAPGHTPGQVTVGVTSRGQRAMISGDAIHHPVQVTGPEITTRADVDPATTVATRRRMLARLAEEDTLLLGTHLTAGSGGRIRRHGGRYTFDPVTPKRDQAGVTSRSSAT